MKKFKLLLFTLIFINFCHLVYAQSDKGRFSGSLETNGSFYLTDKAINAANTPQYDHQLYGADSWLSLAYSVSGFDFGIRFDLFNNSALPDPKDSYTDMGLGRWYIKKKIHNLEISGGYLYNEIGSGIIYKAYEKRPLAIDNALFGLQLAYDIDDNWKVTVFSGKQKQQFDTYKSILKGGNIEGFISGKEGSKWSLAPGFGVVNRTFDEESVDKIINSISTYRPEDSIGVSYNTYAFTLYNTLAAGPFAWYVEGAYKTSEVFFDPTATKLNWAGPDSKGKFVNKAGTVLYSTLSYAKSGLGITLEGKRTENFTFRINPFVKLNRGMINFLPPMTKTHSHRLLTRYNAATQELGEMAYQVDVKYALSRKTTFNVNFSNITDLNDNLLYREIYLEGFYKYKRKWQATAGVQLQSYNQEVYEGKVDVPLVKTVTPFAEFLYRFTRKKSINIETQYLNTQQDHGSWFYLLTELSFAPHWAFAASDMYNIKPAKGDKHHYPRIDVFYKNKSNRFSLGYVKQVEGVVCTGGICRLEPAFSGVKLTINSSF